ncbi:MAG: universal stress protein [Gemmatimonadetes bacterium]|nr:universal stress protein [Gemmatimonadota bacterium]
MNAMKKGDGAWKPQRILVTTDFSENARAAFPYAKAFAKMYDADVDLLSIVYSYEMAVGPMVPLSAAPDYLDGLRDDVLKSLKELAGKESADGKGMRPFVTISSTPVEGILDFANEHDVDLIVMGTRGHGVWRQFLFGSVARSVTQHAKCPVLCVKPGEEGLLDEEGNVSVRRLVVPMDLSKYSETLLRMADELARPHVSKVAALHVVDTLIPPMYQLVGIESLFDLDRDMRKRLEVRVDKLLRECVRSEIETEHHVLEGNASREIARFADEFKADLVIMGRRGVGDTPHLIGGVTERMMHDTHHPILVLP